MEKFINDVLTRFLFVVGLAMLCIIIFTGYLSFILGMEQLLNHTYFPNVEDYTLDVGMGLLVVSILTVSMEKRK